MSLATLVVDPRSTSLKISRHIFSHFAEHLGRCIYGGFFVGEDSSIPNVGGIRSDVVAALKHIGIPSLRWPGGCFADTYHWKDGVGPRGQRPAIVNRWWGDVTEDNSFGTHEFLLLCEQLDVEPYITANLGSGSVKELMDWIQYTNFDGISPMSNLRRVNGREKPWNVKFWGLGNEAWGCGGNMTASYYSNIYRQYATFMTGWSNTQNLFRIASGPNTGDTTWTETLMREIPHGLMEGIAMHYYAVHDWQRRGRAADFTEAQYCESIIAALRMEQLLHDHMSVMDRYDPLGKVALVVDEWGTWYDVEDGTNPGFLYQLNTMRDAIVAAITLNIFINNCRRVAMANIAQTVNVLQALIYTDDAHFWLSPTYHVFDMFKHHQDNRLLRFELQSPHFNLGEFKIQSVSAAASINDNEEVCLTLVNANPIESVCVDISTGGSWVVKTCNVLTSDRISDMNTKDDPAKVCIKPWIAAATTGGFRLDLPKQSVVQVALSCVK